MKIFAGILIVIGSLLLLCAISMDTSVAVNYENGNSYGFPERVNNIGLMNDKSNYTLISIGLIIAGVIMVSVKGEKRYRNIPDLVYKGSENETTIACKLKKKNDLYSNIFFVALVIFSGFIIYMIFYGKLF